MKATWWRQGTAGVTYVRNELPARYLPGKVLNLEDVKDLSENEAGEIIFPRLEGAAIWSFPGNQMRAVLMAAQRNRGHKVIVEVDDLYLIQPPNITPGLKRPWTKAIDFSRDINGDPNDGHSIEAHRRIVMRVANAVICSTDLLATEYREIHNRVFVCQNAVDYIDWQYEKPTDDVLRIGFAGSNSHIIDLPLIFDALVWASKQPNVEIVMIGSIGSQFPFCRHIPWTESLEGYRETLFQLDVGLCPLRPGRWANCKSDLKALEYTMAGALPVVSQVEPYRYWIGHDSPALQAAHANDFLRLVKWCVKNRELIKERASACKDKVLNERTIQGNVWRWDEAINSVEGGI